MYPIHAYPRTRKLLPSLLCLLFLLCASANPASGQQTQNPDNASVQATDAQAQQQQVTTILSNPSLRTRVYRHFFNYQHWLDTVADQQEAAGKDASGLRHAFQKLLGFSDAEYQPIQASIDRVATEMTDLQNEVKSNPGERADYAAARDQMIQAEIDTLNSNLSAKDNAAFEARLVQMFVPRQIIQKEVQQ